MVIGWALALRLQINNHELIERRPYDSQMLDMKWRIITNERNAVSSAHKINKFKCLPQFYVFTMNESFGKQRLQNNGIYDGNAANGNRRKKHIHAIGYGMVGSI